MEENLATNMTLIQRVKDKRDEDSWDEFASSYNLYIKAILIKLGVSKQQTDDLTQEILLALWKSMDSFNYKPQECRFRSWLFTVCKNKVYSFYRSNQNINKNISIPENAPFSNDAEIDRIIEKEWHVYVAKKALERAKTQFKENIIQIYLDFQKGKEPQIIAKEFGVVENTVYVYNKRVKEAMMRSIILLSHELE